MHTWIHIRSLKYFRDGSEGLEDIAINNRKGDKSPQLFNMPKGCFQAIAFSVFFRKFKNFLLLLLFFCHSENREIPWFFLVTTANRNWQKMSHLGNPADKRCDILTTGILICCCHSARPYAPVGAKKLSEGEVAGHNLIESFNPWFSNQ